MLSPAYFPNGVASMVIGTCFDTCRRPWSSEITGPTACHWTCVCTCRDKKQVSYNEHTFFKAADAALEEARPKRK